LFDLLIYDKKDEKKARRSYCKYCAVPTVNGDPFCIELKIVQIKNQLGFAPATLQTGTENLAFS